MDNRLSALYKLFEPTVEALGFDLWGIEYLGQGRYSVLRVYVDKEDGVDVDDCANVSCQLSGILDVEEPITGEYTLEVSSPGLSRPLFKLQQNSHYIGCEVSIRLCAALQGCSTQEDRRNFKGQLLAVVGEHGEHIELLSDGEKFSLPFETIEKASIVPEF